MKYHIGNAIDIHNIRRCIKNTTISIGGYKIENTHYQIIAHSDGDLVLHALSNAILGAIGLRDIGYYFSDKDPKNKNLDSKQILLFALKKMKQKRFKIVNVDIMIICQKIMLKPYYERIVSSLISLLKTSEIGLKATRFEQRSKQIQCNCVVLLCKS